MPTSPLSKALSDKIKVQIEEKDQRIFTIPQLEKLRNELQITLDISDITVTAALNKLYKANTIKKIGIPFTGDKGKIIETHTRFVFGKLEKYALIASLAPHSYYSHQTALYFNDIIKTAPETIYLSYEQSLKKKSTTLLKQKNVDEAFTKPARTPATTGIYLSKRIVLHNGMYTDKLGVKRHASFPGVYYTTPERTLLDLTVRPNYGGGIKSVLATYKKAKDIIDTQILVTMLDSLGYIYPYSQAVGFYMEHAGFSDTDLQLLKKRTTKIDFYLAHGATNNAYSKTWRLNYPEELF
ncbi:MAG: hypothetical protein EOP48_15485 [Sphingobacteriales bacterium]|nr:MAG: hypothetical protein EOP48_15485 [Sphingobacteriales bacterium]